MAFPFEALALKHSGQLAQGWLHATHLAALRGMCAGYCCARLPSAYHTSCHKHIRGGFSNTLSTQRQRQYSQRMSVFLSVVMRQR